MAEANRGNSNDSKMDHDVVTTPSSDSQENQSVISMLSSKKIRKVLRGESVKDLSNVINTVMTTKIRHMCKKPGYFQDV